MTPSEILSRTCCQAWDHIPNLVQMSIYRPILGRQRPACPLMLVVVIKDHLLGNPRPESPGKYLAVERINNHVGMTEVCGTSATIVGSPVIKQGNAKRGGLTEIVRVVGTREQPKLLRASGILNLSSREVLTLLESSSMRLGTSVEILRKCRLTLTLDPLMLEMNQNLNPSMKFIGRASMARFGSLPYPFLKFPNELAPFYSEAYSVD